MKNKKELAVLLSRLKPFAKSNASLEQYTTDSEIAAAFLWDMHLAGDLAGKRVADFGCGTGILGIGALLLGAKEVLFVDVDDKAISLAKENLHAMEKTLGKHFSTSFFCTSVLFFAEHVDMVIQNPPFGVQEEHADRLFVETALKLAPFVYSFHKIESKQFLTSMGKKHGFSVSLLQQFQFPLRQTQSFHTKKVHYVSVGLWRFAKDEHKV